MKRFLIKIMGYDFGKFAADGIERSSKRSALATAVRLRSIYTGADIVVIDRKTNSVIPF